MNRQSSDRSNSKKKSPLPFIPKNEIFLAADTKADKPMNAPSSNEGDVSVSKKGDVSNNVARNDKIPQKVYRPTNSNAAKSTGLALASVKLDPLILRKGDLVRLSNEQKSGRIQGGLARVTRSTFAPDDDKHTGEPTSYNIEYVLGGKLSKLDRCDLSYTTATAEGLVDATDNSRGHLLRRRRSSATNETPQKPVKVPDKGKKKQGKESDATLDKSIDVAGKGMRPGRPLGKISPKPKEKEEVIEDARSKKGRDKKNDPNAAAAKKRRSPKFSDTESSASDVRSQSAKLGWEKRRNYQEAAKAPNKLGRSSKASGTESNASGVRSQAAKLGWEKRRNQESVKAHKPAAKDPKAITKLANKSTNIKITFKRGTKRNSGTDASEADTTYTRAEESTDTDRPSRRMDIMYTRHRRELDKSLVRLEKVDRFGFFLDNPPHEFDETYDNEEGSNDGLEQQAAHYSKVVQFPDQPPFNFLVVRKRFAAGRYDIDMIALELDRFREIRAMMNTSETPKKGSNEEDCVDGFDDMLSKSMSHPIAVDWETFSADIIAMCDAAMIRDPKGVFLGNGHLGWAANKIKKLMEEIYSTYGYKRRLEVDKSEARAKYETILVNCGNMEAAMQGNWRKEAFPERKYERLETSSVICDGLSPKDRSYAMYELETKLPDSFVGLAYTYDDSGQHSETWMKTVADETSQAKPQKPKSKKKKRGIDDSESLTGKNSESKAQKAALALANDGGVVRAQVQTTMTTLLIQVQDRVMTDLGVMHNPEARSANWDDGDLGRDYRGGGAEVEQGTHSGFSLPEVAEQEVWGVDCYTRKNVMALIESEFKPEIAIEFVQKWLLPAINACPVDLAHKVSTAARILEGMPPDPVVKIELKLPKDMDISGTHESEKLQESCVFLRNALESKIKKHGPPWLKAAARLLRLASDFLDDDYFRIHPKGHGSVVIGQDGLKANSLVTYYRGEVYPAWRWCEKLDALEHVQKQLDLRPNLPDFYNMAMERPKKDPRGYCLLFVDASRKSGLGSSFSHSCNPTCEVRVVSLNGKLSLSMTTLRDLEQGEELTFDYNAVTESYNEYKFAICLCGQNNCRGSFLHFATADCYQQVLSRNSPISARFANLVRGCMKQVMSKEDSELLLKHGFNTAAFGAVSFNHHVSSIDPQSNPDLVENVPIWLRTFVADCLRYIEYERRALPVALLCNQMERMEKRQGKSKNAPIPKKEKPEFSNESSSEKLKAIPGSKPKTSYFFYLQSQRKFFENIAKKDGPELKGLELSRAINTEASRAWGNLIEEEKQSWKKKSIADWKKNGGKEKAKLEEERQRLLRKTPKEKIPREATKKDEAKISKSKPSVNNDLPIEAKTISFADADAEGCSAMEQRIQQLSQSLSRVGRVLDRHRESVFDDTKECNAAVDSDLLRDLVPSPLKIMSDEEVVNWIWSDSKGVVSNLFSMIEQHFPEKSLLRELLLSTKKYYPVLSAFSENYSAPSPVDKKFKHSCTRSDARRLVREALLKFRTNIIEFLTFAEKSNDDARNEKRREQARAREKKKHEEPMSEATMPPDITDGHIGMIDDQNKQESEVSIEDSRHVGDELMPTRGAGGECASTNPPNDIFDPRMLGQSSTLKKIGLELLNRSSTEVKDSIFPAPMPPTTDANHAQEHLKKKSTIFQSTVCEDISSLLRLSRASMVPPYAAANHDQESDEPPRVQSTVSEDVKSLLQLSQTANHFGTILSGDTVPDHNNQSCGNPPTVPNEEKKNPLEQVTYSPSRFEDLINAVAINGSGVENNETAVVNDQNKTVTISSPLMLSDAPLLDLPSVSSPETKKAKKRIVPLSEYQMKYLEDWLFDTKHILNPYPTDEEKTIIMKDIRIERKRLDGWFLKNRQRALHPEVRPVKMKWRKLDQDHFDGFRKNRYMLEATADLLLMYASTNTFFLLEPFRQFDSTPIEVYARELGNEVPRHFGLKSQNCKSQTPDKVDSDSDVICGGISKKTKITKECNNELCAPDDVINKVTVDYAGEYVLSQLLQWVNGGIGQKRGLPDIYGCVMLPPIAGCWDDIKCSEVKLPKYTKWNRKTTTEYDANVRSKVAVWFADRYQRGSPWDGDVAKYFCPLDEDSPDPTMPMGSPVLDYLVTGIDENIRQVSAALSEYANTTKQGKSNLSASDRLQSTVDEGMPAQAVANWVQCENPSCLKWRKLPWHVDVDLLPENFFCKDNIWNPKSKTCDASEDEWDMDDAPVKFDLSTNDDNFEVGEWFDVQRKGKVGYHEGQVMELDIKSHVKRVKFHFWKLSSDRDEWIDVGSPRIAPHHAYTPRPLEGYGNKTSDKKKCSNISPSSNLATGALPQKRKIDHLASAKSSECTGGTVDESKTTLPFEKSTIDYLNAWISHHSANPFPSTSEKERIIANTGLSKRQLGDWMARARKKLRKKPSQLNQYSNQDKVQPASEPSVDVTSVKSIQSSPTKVENLLLALRNPLPQQNGSLEGTDLRSTQENTLTMQHQTAVEETSTPLIELGGEKLKTSIKELENYMKTWLSRSENEGNLMPSLGQKEKIIQETGIEKKRLEGWFFRARKKMKKQHESRNFSLVSQKPVTSELSSVTTPTVLNQEVIKKTNASHIKPPTGINLLLMTASKSSQSMHTTQSKENAAIMPTSLMKAGKESQNIPSTPAKTGEANTFNVKSSSKEGSPDDITSSPTSPVKGLTDDAKRYLKRWLSEHSSNPYPSREEKNTMLSFLGIENARGARMLEGWFCRARKKLKQSNSSNLSQPNTKEIDISKVDGNPKSRDEHILHPSGHSADGLNNIDHPGESSFTTSSNFASLLSAAKSELGVNSHRSSPHLHGSQPSGKAASQQLIEIPRFPREDQLMMPGSQKKQQAQTTIAPSRAAKSGLGVKSCQSSSCWDDSKPSGKTASHEPIEVSRFPREERSMMKGSKNLQQTQMPKPHCVPHGFKPSAGDISNTFRKLGAREQAILSSFQSLQSVEIHDRPSPVEYPSYQHSQGQQGAPLAEFPPYQQSQGKQDAPSADYSSHQHSQGHQQDHQQAPPANYSSYQNLQGQQPPANYPSYQHLQGQQQAPPAECPPYQNSRSHHGSPDAENPSYQHLQGQQRASPVDYSPYQQSHRQQQGHPSDYSSYQHSQRQHQGPRVDYSSQGRGYNFYPGPSSNPNSFDGDPNGSHPQGSGFHQEHMAYEQNPNSTYQH